MAKINIDITEIRRQSKLLREASSQLINGTVRPLSEANRDMGAIWTGDAARKFTGYTDELISLLQSNAEDINEISTFLNDVCVTMENADRQALSKL